MNISRRPVFRDRVEAGRALASMLSRFAEETNVLVLALPRGGVPVAAEVARLIGHPLDVLTVRKLGVPGHEEYAMGAIASGGVRFLNQQVIAQLGLTRSEVETVAQREAAELERREQAYRGGREALQIAGQTVIVVDDGIATGSTMFAAIQLLRKLEARRIVVAVPVAPPDTVQSIAAVADEIVVAAQPEPFHAVGCWYDDFGQTTDSEVQELLSDSRHPAEP